ncbi:MAG: N-acetylneuraminate synthase family protein [Euryarchaeota archaeon]|nr:N-acetylneuraminate synthase family protein [Euryarchaeota archaeon]
MIKNQQKTPYIIAETAYNHEGDIKYLYQMIEEIDSLKLNAVKFHLLLNLDSYMKRSHPLYQKIKQWMFTQNQWNTETAKFEGRIILGIGGSSLNDISYAVDFLRHHGKKDVLLMYGFQSYPTNYEDINLAKMHAIQDLFHLPVGYADHTGYDDPNNAVISVAAALMGFPILEKHYTPDPGKERIDYHAAVGKKQMSCIRELMKIAVQVHGSGQITLSEPEKAYGNIGPMKKAIVARRDLKKGEKLTLDNLWFKRTAEESTIQQKQFLQLIGSKAKVDIKKDDVIDFSKIEYRFKTLNLEQFTNIKKKHL